jgi:DNA topoisomerase-1
MTASLEKEMGLVEKGQKQKDEVIVESRELLHTILKKLLEKQLEISQKLREALEAQAILGKCACGGILRIIQTPRGTRFVGCSRWREGCKNSFPLPAKGKITILGKGCAECSMPMISVKYFKKRPFEMCINHRCPSKEGWGKKNAV